MWFSCGVQFHSYIAVLIFRYQHYCLLMALQGSVLLMQAGHFLLLLHIKSFHQQTYKPVITQS